MATTVARPTAPFTKSFFTVVSEATTAKTSEIKDTFKLLRYVMQWLKIAHPALPSNYVAFGEMAGDGKNFISGLEIPKNLSEIAIAFTGTGDKARVYNKIDTICRLSNNGGDLIKLLSRYFTIPHMKHIEGGSGAFTFVGSVNNAIEHGRLLWNLDEIKDDECRWNNGVHQVINLISDFAYMVFGALAVSVWLGLITVPMAAIILPLSIALICSFTNYYFKNLVNLNDEYPDPKKAIVAVNYVRGLPPTGEPIPASVMV